MVIQNRIQAVRFAADEGCFCLIGRTMLIRSKLLQDEEFLHASKQLLGTILTPSRSKFCQNVASASKNLSHCWF
jgi:hypothetical protein